MPFAQHHLFGRQTAPVAHDARMSLSEVLRLGRNVYRWRDRFCCLLLVVLIASACSSALAQQLQITYGAKGIQTLSFAGTTLENVNAFSADAFHIYHMKCEDMAGNALFSGQYGWGESNNGTTWNAATHTETYNFSWGTIATQFVQNGNTLDIIVTETNFANSRVKFDGAEIYPLTLHFPQDPSGFNGYSQFLNTTAGPAVSAADFGSGVVTAVIPDESIPMHGGWKNAGNNTYTPLMTTTSPDGLAAFLPHTDHPIAPGSTLRYTMSLRFTAAGVAANAADAYSSFASTYPSQMTWSDHRILGTAYLASSPPNPGDKTQPGGFPKNPRRYFNDPSIDVTTPAGLRSFQARILAQAASNLTNARAMNGQGVITWDLEGEQFPQDTSYVCSPDQIAAVAPEMESVISDRQSPYFGLRLDDAYFKTMTDAGLRVGVCVRPQAFTLSGNGTASQSFLTGNNAIVANLEKKIMFSNKRWGATVFYIDSTVDSIGGTLDAAIFQKLITDFPAFLFIPEEFTPRYYAYSAPFYSFIFHGRTGTDASVYQYYPNAFGANLVNDVATSTLQSAVPALTRAVSKGDILMGHADYWQANDPILNAIYQAAGMGALPPIRVTPVISWQTPASIPYGTPLSSTQLNAVTNAAGSFTYSPAAGTILPGGVNTLLSTFTPTETRDYTTATASTTITVTPATPQISWNTPSPIASGTPLGPAQLNAVANTAGSFTYSPAAGSILPGGVTTLLSTFTPTDTRDYTTATASTTITVTAATPQISWNTPQSITAGTPLGIAQLNATASVPGTFQYSPPAGTVLPVGTQILTSVFTPADPRAYSSQTTSVGLQVIAPAAKPSGNLYITGPLEGDTLSGSVTVAAICRITLDSAGTYLMVDGMPVSDRRVVDGPYLYPLDTRKLANGTHILQIWAHDIGNNVTVSSGVSISVVN